MKMDKQGNAFLKDACADARKWAKGYPTLAEAWEACVNPEWMCWALNRLGYDDPVALRRFACWCVRNTSLPDGRKVWDLLTDERSRKAVEVAEAFANGDATEEELAAAWAAAWDAARAAARAAWDAARAAWDAARAAARAAARDAARAAARAAQSNALRTFISNPFIKASETDTETGGVS